MSSNLRDRLQTTLGDNYTVDRELGGGGMSRVFVADDNTLGRKIVVKMLPSDTAGGVSVERFKREIQVIARLQHPHIVPILSAGEIDGLPFYTMPFVKGESLRARLQRSGEMSVNEAVHIMRDVAAALAYSHGEGVVHRDIKPDNVIMSGGVAVVTDFGVSKAVDVSATEGGGAATGITSMGVALGTPAYMSPEQASADPQIDHRADIYSFGCLAYELLAGTSPFGGRSPQQMLAAHVTEQPESLLKRRPNIPPALATLVMRCLEKHAGDRPQSADELLTALDSISTTPSGGMSPTASRLAAVGRGGAGKWIALGTATALLIILGSQVWLRSSAPGPLSIGSTISVAASPDLEYMPAISPDGKIVAFVAPTANGTRIFIKQIDGGRATVLTGELGAVYHSMPSWSPDGSRIAFVGGRDVYVVPALTGGLPKRVVENAQDPRWSPDGSKLVITRGDGVWIHPLDGTAEQRLVAGTDLHNPSWSPAGGVIAYADGNPPSMTNISAGTIWTVGVGGGTPKRVSDSTHTNLSPVWTPGGKSLLYISNRDNTRDVYQQRMRSNGSPIGEPVRVTTALGSYYISLSADGSRLAYDVVRNYSNIWSVPIAASTAASISDARQVTRENQHVEGLNVSHDGKWLVYDSDRAGNSDIFKVRVEGGDPIQLTTNAGNDFLPAWSPDDRKIVFHSHRGATRDIYVMSSDGDGEQQVTSGPEQDVFPEWSPDGKSITFARSVGGSSPGTIAIVTREAGGKWSAPRVISPDSVSAFAPAKWSPDGTSVAFVDSAGSRILLSSVAGKPTRTLVDSMRLGALPLYLAWAGDPSVIYVTIWDPAVGMAILRVPISGKGSQRILVETPAHRLGREVFTTDGKRLYFTLGQWESDVNVMELKR